LEPPRLTNRFDRLSDRGCGIGGYIRLPGADEPTIGITMPMTDKPLRRVKGEQRNEIGRVRRNKTRRDSPVDISICGSHSLRLLR
jgi:hypothetical protein